MAVKNLTRWKCDRCYHYQDFDFDDRTNLEWTRVNYGDDRSVSIAKGFHIVECDTVEKVLCGKCFEPIHQAFYSTPTPEGAN